MFVFGFILCLVLLLADVCLFVGDQYVWSFVVLVVTGIVGYMFIPIVTGAVDGYGLVGILVHILPVYLAIGIGVALIKWVIFHLKFATRVSDVKALFQKKYPKDVDHHTTKTRQALFIEFWNALPTIDSRLELRYTENPQDLVNQLTPKAVNHVSRITFWILQWPVVIVGTLVEDFLIKIGKHVARIFDRMFTKISQVLIRKITKDL